MAEILDKNEVGFKIMDFLDQDRLEKTLNKISPRNKKEEADSEADNEHSEL